MATLLTKRIEREIPQRILENGHRNPLVFTFAPEGICVRAKRSKVTYGPMSWESLFFRIAQQDAGHSTGGARVAERIAKHNPTFSKRRASTTPLAAEMAVEVGND